MTSSSFLDLLKCFVVQLEELRATTLEIINHVNSNDDDDDDDGMNDEVLSYVRQAQLFLPHMTLDHNTNDECQTTSQVSSNSTTSTTCVQVSSDNQRVVSVPTSNTATTTTTTTTTSEVSNNNNNNNDDDDDENHHVTIDNNSIDVVPTSSDQMSPRSSSGIVPVDPTTLPQLPPASTPSRRVSRASMGGDESLYGDEVPNHKAFFRRNSEQVRLNVGGRVFVTTSTTLLMDPNSMFAGLLSDSFGGPDDEATNTYFIDRSPVYFDHVLNYLRDGRIDIQPNSTTPLFYRALLREARFYQVSGLVKELSSVTRVVNWRNDPSTEKIYKMVNLDLSSRATPIERFTYIQDTLRHMTMQEGYDYHSSIDDSQDRRYLVFTKTLTKGELMLLDRLQTHM